MAVAAIANRYSNSMPPTASSRAAWIPVLVPLALPALLVLVPFVAAVVVVGLALTIAFSRIVPAVRAAHSPGALLGGRIALCITAFAFLPGTIIDLRDVIVRDDTAADARHGDSAVGEGCQSSSRLALCPAGDDPSPRSPNRKTRSNNSPRCCGSLRNVNGLPRNAIDSSDSGHAK
jgi:hypothetical protein